MKIKAIRIQNFRTFEDVTVVLNDYTCFVGPNGAGKSTILCALNVFFQNTEASVLDLVNLEREDFHKCNIERPITITVTFDDLDSEAQNDFSDYYRSGDLVVSAVAEFDPQTERATVKQFGLRSGMLCFAPFFEAAGDGKPVSELKAIYEGIRAKVSALPAAATKPKMMDALRAYEMDHPEQRQLIPSSDQFYGVSKGANRLAKHIQWVYLPAVKDATQEQFEERDTALGKLISRAVRSKVDFDASIAALRSKTQTEYTDLLKTHQGALTDLTSSLNQRLKEWAHPEASLKLEWKQDSVRSVRIEDPFAGVLAGEGPFEGNLARFGHGLQRSYLLALLQELAGGNGTAGPKLILACEEPELYQHPPQARHLAEVLTQLSQRNTQVMVCTHSPFFVSGRGFEDIRLIRKSRGAASAVASLTYEELKIATAAIGMPEPKKELGTIARIHQALQPAANEIFFAPVLILVEGLEDVAYLTTYFHLLDLWSEFRRLGCHIVPTNGKHHMIQPLCVAKKLGIPTFVVFDSDATQKDRNGSQQKHLSDNGAILKLCNSNAAPLPTSNVWEPGCVMWHSNIGDSVEADFDAVQLSALKETVRLRCGQIADLEKNSLFIAEWLDCAWQASFRSPTLERVCRDILAFAANSTPSAQSPSGA